MAELKFRKMELNDKVAIELPVHIWLGFLYGYSGSDWSNMCAGEIASAVQEAVMDPVFLKEQAAKQQEHIDLHNAAFQTMVTGRPPEMPPNMTDTPPFGAPWNPTTNPDGYPGGSDDYPGNG